MRTFTPAVLHNCTAFLTPGRQGSFIPIIPIRVRSSSGNFHLSRSSLGTNLRSQGQYAKETQRSELIAILSI
uniref:Uncharacterized protein n=1 Tax=Arundo donax TaxID=35708 RepID=A0A0A9DVY6_ARUDO